MKKVHKRIFSNLKIIELNNLNLDVKLNILNSIDLFKNLSDKIYLSKDSRQTSEVFFKTYKNFEEWLKIKYEMDPKCIFTSDLAERYKLFKS